mgnify:CR=1 FL=1
MGDLSAHFSSLEFICHCGCRQGGNRIDARLIALLEALRETVAAPIRINSGFRCPKHNKAVGGEPHSYHMTGQAADITVEGMTPAIVASAAEKLKGIGGIGKYKTWTHIDCGPKGRRWKR